MDFAVQNSDPQSACNPRIAYSTLGFGPSVDFAAQTLDPQSAHNPRITYSTLEFGSFAHVVVQTSDSQLYLTDYSLHALFPQKYIQAFAIVYI